MHTDKHDHDHGHGHFHAGAQDRKRLLLVMSLSLVYMVAEIVGGVMSGSLALLADAGHMALDVAATALGLFAAWIALKPPDSEKTYGYYRAEILAALLNGATLVAISFWIFFEAWERYREPHVIKGELMTLVALGGLIVNLASLAVMHRNHERNLNIHGVWLHVLTDTLGSVAALAAAFLIWTKQWYQADPVISVFIGILILIGAWQLLSECVNVLLEGVPKGMDYHKIHHGILSIAKVAAVHDLHIWTLTSGVVSLSAHIVLKEDGCSKEVLSAISAYLRDEYHIEHVTVQLEPPGYEHKLTHI